MLQFSKACLLLVTFLCADCVPGSGRKPMLTKDHRWLFLSITMPASRRRYWSRPSRKRQRSSTMPDWMSSGRTARPPGNHVGPDVVWAGGRARLARFRNPNPAGLRPAGRVGHPPLRSPVWSELGLCRLRMANPPCFARCASVQELDERGLRGGLPVCRGYGMLQRCLL